MKYVKKLFLYNSDCTLMSDLSAVGDLLFIIFPNKTKYYNKFLQILPWVFFKNFIPSPT